MKSSFFIKSTFFFSNSLNIEFLSTVGIGVHTGAAVVPSQEESSVLLSLSGPASDPEEVGLKEALQSSH